MTDQEVLDVIRKSLSIKVSKEYDFYGNVLNAVTIDLCLNDEVISSEFVSFAY